MAWLSSCGSVTGSRVFLSLLSAAGLLLGCGGDGGGGSASTESEFHCEAGGRVSETKVCDGSRDCPDGSDENGCDDDGFGGSGGSSGSGGSGGSGGSSGTGASGGTEASGGFGGDDSCSSDFECDADQYCDSFGECTEGVPPGGDCSSSTECTDDLACNDGQCGPCTEECSAGERCSETGDCVPEGELAGVTLNIQIDLTEQAGQTYTYDVSYGVVIFDGSGDSFEPSGDLFFTLEDFEKNGMTVDWDQQVHLSDGISCTEESVTLEDRAISVGLTMDQSGSISSTDPMDLRISAAKEFLLGLEPRDESLLVSFASGNSCVSSDIALWNNGFSSSHDRLISVLEDELLGCEGGGTPLYDASVSAIDKVTQTAQHDAKALVVFTDGDDTDSSADASDVIQAANAAQIRVFTVGLSEGVNSAVLGKMAQQTDGAFFFADEIGTLVTSFRALNELLRGTYTIYDCTNTLTVTVPEGQVPNFITQSILIEHQDALLREFALARMYVGF